MSEYPYETSARDLGLGNRPTIYSSVPATSIFWLKKTLARGSALLLNEKWAVGIVKAPIHSFLDSSFVPTVHWINCCDSLEFLADCFGIVEGDRRFVLAERFSYRGASQLYFSNKRLLRSGRGHITSIAIDQDGRIISESPAIDTGLHMSYPCTLSYRGSWYLVAEEVSNDRLNLYTLARDGKWQHIKELLPYPVIDPTIFPYEDRWWLFGTSPSNPNSELKLWSANRPDGNWEPHACNPVRIDPRNTRPAGTPFVFEKRLYRPTQNSTKTYGGSVVINQIDILTPHAFREHPIREVFPPPFSPYQDGIHTLSAFGEWTLLDAKTHLLLPRVVVKNVTRKVVAACTRFGQHLSKPFSDPPRIHKVD